MAPLDVVEVVDVVADRFRRSFSGRVVLVVDEFCSERRKEALGYGIVPAVALAAHASTHTLSAQLGAIVVARVGSDFNGPNDAGGPVVVAALGEIF